MNTDKIHNIEEAWESHQFVILDTETTGLKYPAEIIQICVLDFMGDRLVDSYVKPVGKIPTAASEIHGIYDADVIDAPDWQDVRQDVIEVITGKYVIIYNADYDTQMLRNTDKIRGIDFSWASIMKDSFCAMRWYADIWREIDPYYGTPRWQKLSNACAQQGIMVKDAHHAYGDCKMTHALITKIMSDRAKERILSTILPEAGECEHVSIFYNEDECRFECDDCGRVW